jgi:hypothetical protein
MGWIRRGGFIAIVLGVISCSEPVKQERFVDNDIKTKLAQFAPIEIGVDDALIPTKHRPLLKKLVEAARIIDTLFAIQVARENPTWRADIASQEKSEDMLAYFDMMYGPWDRLDRDQPFWGRKKKPPGAAFYPEDLTKTEFETWIEAHPKQEDAFHSYFTVIARRPGARIGAVQRSVQDLSVARRDHSRTGGESGARRAA